MLYALAGLLALVGVACVAAWLLYDELTGVNLGYWLDTRPGTRYYVSFVWLAILAFGLATVVFIIASRFRTTR